MTISRPPETKKEVSNKTADDFIKGKPAASQATQISLKLPRQLLDAIDARAVELSISRAAFIKQACAIYLEQA